MSSLLLNFKSKTTKYAVSRKTLKSLATVLEVTESMAVHLALSKMAQEYLPAYEADDGPLNEGDIQRIKEKAAPLLPKGKILKTESFF